MCCKGCETDGDDASGFVVAGGDSLLNFEGTGAWVGFDVEKSADSSCRGFRA